MQERWLLICVQNTNVLFGSLTQQGNYLFGFEKGLPCRLLGFEIYLEPCSIFVLYGEGFSESYGMFHIELIIKS